MMNQETSQRRTLSVPQQVAIDQIARTLIDATDPNILDRNTELNLNLTPSSLGKILYRLFLEPKCTVQIEVDSTIVREIVQAQLPIFLQGLKNMGIPVEQIEMIESSANNWATTRHYLAG